MNQSKNKRNGHSENHSAGEIQRGTGNEPRSMGRKTRIHSDQSTNEKKEAPQINGQPIFCNVGDVVFDQVWTLVVTGCHKQLLKGIYAHPQPEMKPSYEPSGSDFRFIL